MMQESAKHNIGYSYNVTPNVDYISSSISFTTQQQSSLYCAMIKSLAGELDERATNTASKYLGKFLELYLLIFSIKSPAQQYISPLANWSQQIWNQLTLHTNI